MPNPLDFTPSRNALYDASQGASRAFWAGGAGAPVDMFTGLLNAPLMLGGYVGNKLGLLSGNQMPQPITKPVGGSEWLAEKMRAMGLLQDAPGTVADEWGQAVGGLLGPVAAAKAPQIAAMANRGMANLAVPATMNKQMGAIVYHGSPHKFDAFDSSKIGTGEGTNEWGPGIYQAAKEKVASTYIPQSGGYIYKSELPDEKIAPMLNADIGWQSQSAGVKSVWLEYLKEFEYKTPNEALAHAKRVSRNDYGKLNSGNGMYEIMRHDLGEGELIKRLKDSGVPGIRYLDGGSRGAGTGTSNYVVFPGEESALKILERNGRGLLSP
jgi:hypothetical protein